MVKLFIAIYFGISFYIIYKSYMIREMIKNDIDCIE